MATKKRALLFTQDMAGGGAERVMAHLANGLTDLGIEVSFALCQKTGPNLKLLSEQVTIYDLQQPKVMSSLVEFLAVCEHVKPDAVLSALNQPNVVAIRAQKRTGIPTTITLHNDISSYIQAGKGIKRRLMPFFAKLFYPQSSHVVSCSQGLANDFSRVIPRLKGRIQVIYNPVVAPNLFERAAETPEHEWVNGDQPLVVAFGRLDPQKDFGNLIRAFGMMQKVKPSRLLIYGEGPEREGLQALIKSLGLESNVQLPGFTSNPYAFMRNATVLAMSSMSEGLPTVLIEGLAAGSNIVSTNCPSGPDEILDGGRLGALVPVNDSGALAQALIQAITNPRPPASPDEYQRYLISHASLQYAKVLFPGEF